MSTRTTDSFTIADGPSADRIVDALKYAFTDRVASRQTAEFIVAVSLRLSVPYQVQITHLSYESGTEGMFIFKGNLVGDGRVGTVEGFYNAKSRTGTINIKRS